MPTLPWIANEAVPSGSKKPVSIPASTPRRVRPFAVYSTWTLMVKMTRWTSFASIYDRSMERPVTLKLTGNPQSADANWSIPDSLIVLKLIVGFAAATGSAAIKTSATAPRTETRRFMRSPTGSPGRSVSPVAQRGGTATVNTSALRSLPRFETS